MPVAIILKLGTWTTEGEEHFQSKIVSFHKSSTDENCVLSTTTGVAYWLHMTHYHVSYNTHTHTHTHTHTDTDTDTTVFQIKPYYIVTLTQ